MVRVYGTTLKTTLTASAILALLGCGSSLFNASSSAQILSGPGTPASASYNDVTPQFNWHTGVTPDGIFKVQHCLQAGPCTTILQVSCVRGVCAQPTQADGSPLQNYKFLMSDQNEVGALFEVDLCAAVNLGLPTGEFYQVSGPGGSVQATLDRTITTTNYCQH